MEAFFILSFTPVKPKAVFEEVNGMFYCGPDLVGAVPLLHVSESARVGRQIPFRIKMDHSPV